MNSVKSFATIVYLIHQSNMDIHLKVEVHVCIEYIIDSSEHNAGFAFGPDDLDTLK